jgi:hypothetical protein
MYEEMVKTLKTVLCAVILLSMFKIYENGGYSNPITIAVLIIMFSLWILFRIELNEEVSQEEINDEGDDKQSHTNSQHTSQQSSNNTAPRGRHTPRPLAPTSLEKRQSKFRALVRRSRSRSKSPDQIFRR